MKDRPEHKGRCDESVRAAACCMARKLTESVDVRTDYVTEALMWDALLTAHVEEMRAEDPDGYARYLRLRGAQVAEIQEAMSEIAAEDAARRACAN